MQNIGIKGLAVSFLALSAACAGPVEPAPTAPQQYVDTSVETARNSQVGFHTLTSNLIVPDVDMAILHYGAAFGARARSRQPGPDGHTLHAAMELGDSMLWLSRANPRQGSQAPAALGGTPVSLTLYVENADAVFRTALAAGATPVMTVPNQVWGDRYRMVEDRFGHKWGIVTLLQDLTTAQMAARAELLHPRTSHLTRRPARGTAAAEPPADRYHTLTPDITVRDIDAMLAFCKSALGGQEIDRSATPEGHLQYVEMVMGDSMLTLHAEHPETGRVSPESLGGTPFGLMVYVHDVDQAYRRALTAGARSKSPPRALGGSRRFAEIVDPSGHTWRLIARPQR